MMPESGHTAKPVQPQGAGRLDFGLLRDFQSIIDLDAKVSDGAFQLGMAKQQLNGPQVLRALVDQGCLGSPHGVGSIG